MFYYLKGTVAAMEAQLAVIDCGGVGYACNTTATTLGSLRLGDQAKLFTCLYIREDAFDIYGFATQRELSMFKSLIGVTGVGPKAALSILSAATPEQLALSIMTGDEKALTVAPGIGKKLAQRVILELKDKLDLETSDGFLPQTVPATAAAKSAFGDAQAALMALGYNQNAAAAALRDIDVENTPLQEVVRQALRKMI